MRVSTQRIIREGVCGISVAIPLTDCPAICFNRRMTVLELDKLVSHQSPRWQVIAIELKRSFEVLDGFGVFLSCGVIVSWE